MSVRKVPRYLGVFAFGALSFAQIPAPKPPVREAELLANKQALPDYDSRRNVKAEITADKAKAGKDLQQRLGPGARVDLSAQTGGVRQAFRLQGYLSPGQAGDPRAALNRFLADNSNVFGLSAGDLQTYLTTQQQKDDTGVTHLYLTQEIGGIRVFQSLIKGHVDGNGRIVSVEGGYYPGVTTPTQPATLTAESAVRAAMLATMPDLLQKAATNNKTSPPSRTDTIVPVSTTPPQRFRRLSRRPEVRI